MNNASEMTSNESSAEVCFSCSAFSLLPFVGCDSCVPVLTDIIGICGSTHIQHSNFFLSCCWYGVDVHYNGLCQNVGVEESNR